MFRVRDINDIFWTRNLSVIILGICLAYQNISAICEYVRGILLLAVIQDYSLFSDSVKWIRGG